MKPPEVSSWCSRLRIQRCRPSCSTGRNAVQLHSQEAAQQLPLAKSRTPAWQALFYVLGLRPEPNKASLLPLQNPRAEKEGAGGLHTCLAGESGTATEAPLFRAAPPPARSEMPRPPSRGRAPTGRPATRPFALAPGGRFPVAWRNRLAVFAAFGDACAR